MSKNSSEIRFKNTLQETMVFKGVQEQKHYCEPNMDAELCVDLENSELKSSYKRFKCFNMKGSILYDFLLKNFGLIKSNKKDATAVFFIGEYSDECRDTYKKGVKHYWLKNK